MVNWLIHYLRFIIWFTSIIIMILQIIHWLYLLQPTLPTFTTLTLLLPEWIGGLDVRVIVKQYSFQEIWHSTLGYNWYLINTIESHQSLLCIQTSLIGCLLTLDHRQSGECLVQYISICNCLIRSIGTEHWWLVLQNGMHCLIQYILVLGFIWVLVLEVFHSWCWWKNNISIVGDLYWWGWE